jgi:hypothetical protein
MRLEASAKSRVPFRLDPTARSVRRWCWSPTQPAPCLGRPRWLFEDTKVVARQAGALKGRARVLDSTPLLDAVATQDTVTQLRAAIRTLLMVLDNVASSIGVHRGIIPDADEAQGSPETSARRRRRAPVVSVICSTSRTSPDRS